MNFVIFLCITRKLFSLNVVPLLASNPGDATGGGGEAKSKVVNFVTSQYSTGIHCCFHWCKKCKNSQRNMGVTYGPK